MNKWIGNGLLMTFIPFLNEHTWKTFSITSTIFIKTKFTTEEETGELVFHDSLLKQNNLKMFVLVYRKPAHTDHTTALTTKQVSRKVLFPPCLIEYTLLSSMKMT